MRRPRLSGLQVGLLTIGLVVVFVFFAVTKTNPFANPYELQATFRDARSIGMGAPVRIAGVEVGKVTKLESNGDGAATVTMELRDDALPLHRDARLKIRPRILLEGNYFVDIQPGTPSAPTLDDGSTVPLTQTATSVSLPEILAVLTTDTRNDLRTLLEEYGTKALGNGGAEGVNRAIPYFSPAYRRTAITNEALLGVQPNRDLPRLLRGQARTFGALASRPEELKDLVTDLDVVAGALASQDAALEASVPALRDTLAAGYPALGDVDAALPTLRVFSREALPGVRSTTPTLDVGIPWIAQARAPGASGRAQGPGGRPAAGGAGAREAQPPARPAERAAARALLVHEQRAGAVRRVPDPQHRGRELRSGGAPADPPQLRRACR